MTFFSLSLKTREGSGLIFRQSEDFVQTNHPEGLSGLFWSPKDSEFAPFFFQGRKSADQCADTGAIEKRHTRKVYGKIRDAGGEHLANGVSKGLLSFTCLKGAVEVKNGHLINCSDINGHGFLAAAALLSKRSMKFTPSPETTPTC